MLAFHIGAGSSSCYFTSDPAPCSSPGKAVEDDPCAWVPASYWETQLEFLIPGFHLCCWQPSGEWTNRAGSLALSFATWMLYIVKSNLQVWFFFVMWFLCGWIMPHHMDITDLLGWRYFGYLETKLVGSCVYKRGKMPKDSEEWCQSSDKLLLWMSWLQINHSWKIQMKRMPCRFADMAEWYY